MALPEQVTHPSRFPVLKTEYPHSLMQQNSMTFPQSSRIFLMISSQSPVHVARPYSHRALHHASHTHVCRNLVQSGTNIAKDLKTREFGQEIVNNATTGRQIFHVRTDHVLRRILPIWSAFLPQRTHFGTPNFRTYRPPRTRSCRMIFSLRTSEIRSTKRFRM